MILRAIYSLNVAKYERSQGSCSTQSRSYSSENDGANPGPNHETSSPERNFYQILGVPKTASSKEIRLRYLELVKMSHPDSPNLIKTVEECDILYDNFVEIQEAYETLINEESRKAYDLTLKQSYNSGPNIYASYYGKGVMKDPATYFNRIRLGIRDETQDYRDFIHREAKRQYETQGIVRMNALEMTKHKEGNPFDTNYSTFRRPQEVYQEQQEAMARQGQPKKQAFPPRQARPEFNWNRKVVDEISYDLRLRILKFLWKYRGTSATLFSIACMALTFNWHKRNNPKTNLNL